MSPGIVDSGMLAAAAAMHDLDNEPQFSIVGDAFSSQLTCSPSSPRFFVGSGNNFPPSTVCCGIFYRGWLEALAGYTQPLLLSRTTMQVEYNISVVSGLVATDLAFWKLQTLWKSMIYCYQTVVSFAGYIAGYIWVAAWEETAKWKSLLWTLFLISTMNGGLLSHYAAFSQRWSIK